MLPTLTPPLYYSFSKLLLFLKCHPESALSGGKKREAKKRLFLEYQRRAGRGGCEWTRDREISGAGEEGDVDSGNTLRPPKAQELDALGIALLSQPGSTGAREALSSRIRTWPSPPRPQVDKGPPESREATTVEVAGCRQWRVCCGQKPGGC